MLENRWIGPRIHRSWLEHLDDETWDVVDADDIESWLKTCASFEPVSESNYCKIEMTAIVTRDVNAVYMLKCAHRRQLLAARALNERSLLIRGLPFPRTKTIGDLHIDDLVILSALQFPDVHVASLPIEVRRADALYDFFQMPTNAGKSGSTLTGEFWEGHLDGVAGTHAHHDAGCCYWNKSDTPPTPPRRVGLFPRVLARSICLHRRRQLCSRVSGSKQATSSEWSSDRRASPYHRTRSFAETNLRAEPCEKLHATDASPDGAGGCAASIAQDAWLALYDLVEEKGEHVRLHLKGEEPPSNMHDGRAAAAPIAVKLNRTTMFSYRFSKGASTSTSWIWKA